MLKRVLQSMTSTGIASALQAVLSEIQNCDVDAIVVGGDLAWGPQPALVMEQLFFTQRHRLFHQGKL